MRGFLMLTCGFSLLFRLPVRTQVKENEVMSVRQNIEDPNGNKLSILILDDDPVVTSVSQTFFQKSGFQVDVENDPFVAIERMRNSHYDILLLDFLMSPICGDQVVDQVRRFNQDIFIILLTGHKNLAPPIKTIRALDIQGYCEKSERFDQLELVVEFCAKSIHQMKTIKSYKDGLTAIVDALPKIHTLSSLDHVTASILKSVMDILPCRNAVLALDSVRCPDGHSHEEDGRFICKSRGAAAPTLSTWDAERFLSYLHGNSSAIYGDQIISPITDGESNLLGLLVLELSQGITYDQVQLLEIFVRQASSAISNARLHAMLHEKTLLLQSNYLEIIHAMRRVVDMKDQYTRGHSDRVSFYAYHLAKQLGKSEDYCERVRLAGLFHDTGKLSVPDEILLKPTKLTDEEFQIIKTHPASGEELLSALYQFRPILPAVRGHHERFDGLGYPDGLKGYEIPEEARIIAVADTFDAMTSNRQYRSALTIEFASNELNRCKDSQLDGRVVSAFQELIAKHEFWQIAQNELGSSVPDSLQNLPASSD